MPNSRSVLLVNDSEDALFLYKSYLEIKNYAVDIAANGIEALKLFQDNRYDVVLMDVKMPDMDGYTATRCIREWEQSKNRTATPIIAFTAGDIKQEESRSRNAGCDALLILPCPLSRLAETIEKILPGETSEGESERQQRAVRIRTALKKLIPKFIAKKHEEIVMFRKFARDADFKSIESLGHSVKGSAGGYGFAELSEIGARLEKMGKEKAADRLNAEIDRLEAYLNTVKIDYR